MKELNSEISGFYKLKVEERQKKISQLIDLSQDDLELLREFGYFKSNELGDSLDCHVVVKPKMTVEESHNLNHKLSSLIQEKFKDYSVNIHIEPPGNGDK